VFGIRFGGSEFSGARESRAHLINYAGAFRIGSLSNSSAASNHHLVISTSGAFACAPERLHPKCVAWYGARGGEFAEGLQRADRRGEPRLI
jgi:hypothetical protein